MYIRGNIPISIGIHSTSILDSDVYIIEVLIDKTCPLLIHIKGENIQISSDIILQSIDKLIMYLEDVITRTIVGKCAYRASSLGLLHSVEGINEFGVDGHISQLELRIEPSIKTMINNEGDDNSIHQPHSSIPFLMMTVDTQNRGSRYDIYIQCKIHTSMNVSKLLPVAYAMDNSFSGSKTSSKVQKGVKSGDSDLITTTINFMMLPGAHYMDKLNFLVYILKWI